MKQVFRRLGPNGRARILHQFRRIKNVRRRSQGRWRFPWRTEPAPESAFRFYPLAPGRRRIIAEYARNLGATVNEVLLASYYLALQAQIPRTTEGAVSMFVAVDLRRYLEQRRSEAICNLVGGVVIGLDVPAESDLPAVTRLVHDQIEPLRENIGLGSVPQLIESSSAFQFLWKCLPFSLVKWLSSRASNFEKLGVTSMSELVLSHDRLRYGEEKITGAIMTPPIYKAPGVCNIAVSCFGDELVLISALGRVLDADSVESLLQEIDRQLPH